MAHRKNWIKWDLYVFWDECLMEFLIAFCNSLPYSGKYINNGLSGQCEKSIYKVKNNEFNLINL